jgi:uncharacterized Zn-binding protein involved in type VI secretion
MSRPLIVLDDATSHGGRVITADYSWDINGKPVARVGDMTVCPRCKGTFPITSGAPDAISMGQAPARHGDSTACGAKLISSQSLSTWSDESSMGGNAQDEHADTAIASAAVAVPTTSGVCLECMLKAAAAGAATVVRS